MKVHLKLVTVFGEDKAKIAEKLKGGKESWCISFLSEGLIQAWLDNLKKKKNQIFSRHLSFSLELCAVL